MTVKVVRVRGGITPAIRQQVLDSGPCAYCGEEDPSVVDHIVPIVQDGHPSDPDNLAPACVRCNTEKGGDTPDQWEARSERLGRPWPPPNFNEWCTAWLSCEMPTTPGRAWTMEDTRRYDPYGYARKHGIEAGLTHMKQTLTDMGWRWD